MAFVWTADLETGNSLIDGEHKNLFVAINKLLVACQQGKGRKEMIDCVDFLAHYTKTHFAHEEALQLESKYPAYAAHKLFHTGYLRQIDDVAKKLKEQGASIAILGEFNTKISILVQHIKNEDSKIATHIKMKKG